MEAAPDLGRALDSAVIQKGLSELNKDIAFDVAVKRPSDWTNVLQLPDSKAIEAIRKKRMPVMYRDSYVCGLDRGMVPEFKQWSVKTQVVEIPWSDADKDGSGIRWETINPSNPCYVDLYIEASKGVNPTLMIMAGGSLARCYATGEVKCRYRVITLGWRHTFERIIKADIAGATRSAIALKFGVDMLKYPVGDPEEIRAALIEE